MGHSDYFGIRCSSFFFVALFLHDGDDDNGMMGMMDDAVDGCIVGSV